MLLISLEKHCCQFCCHQDASVLCNCYTAGLTAFMVNTALHRSRHPAMQPLSHTLLSGSVVEKLVTLNKLPKAATKDFIGALFPFATEIEIIESDDPAER